MSTLANKPYIPMFMSILIIFIVLPFVNPNEFIDIQLHDTYLVISPIHLGAILFYLGLTGIIYWLLRKLSCVKWMTITHIIFTILACVFFQIFSLISSKFIEIDNNAIRIMHQITTIILFGILSRRSLFICGKHFS